MNLREVREAASQHLWHHDPSVVLDMGGWWKRVPHPPNEELRRLLNEQLPVVQGENLE